VTRSQLNFKIDPELLKRVKSTAAQRGLTVTEFVCQCLEAACDEDACVSLEQRVKRIEQHLGFGD
jgi:uncharacterized protein (DUF1778 family)